MKVTKLISSAVIALYASVSFATVPAVLVENEQSFSISTIGDGNSSIFYSCDAVERAAEDYLAAMGAIDIEVRCSGGIEQGFTGPAFVRTEYINAASAKSSDATHAATYRMVELEGRETSGTISKGHGCHLMREIHRGLAETFETRNMETRFSCSGFSKRYSISLESLSL